MANSILEETISKHKVTKAGGGKIKLNTEEVYQSTFSYYVDKLEERFPDKLPTKLISEAEVSKLIGNQEVITYLKSILYKEQTNKKG